MTAVTLIQCTDGKRDEPAPAADLYDKSAYFRDMRAWARARGDPWYILSAKHGLLAPERETRPYDNRGVNERLAKRVATDIEQLGVDTVHVTAGRGYTDHLVPELERRGIDVVNHFAGERIGTRRSLLQQATRKLNNETLC